MGSQVSSDEMSVRAGQGSDEVLVSQAVWDYLAAAGRPWLLDFQRKQGMNAEMSKQEGGPKRKRTLLPCMGVLEPNSEGSLMQVPTQPPPRRSQRQQQKLRKSAEEEALSVFHEAACRKDCEATNHNEVDDTASCSICMGDIVDKTTLEKCGHSFCRSCLDQAFKVKRACPVCRLVYGQLIGNQPANGTMYVERDSALHLPGHEAYGCICIIYSFPAGLQAPEHPNPGVRYPGTDRLAYLPDSPDGNRVLGLLRRAFEQRLTFTVGTSMTTGLQNVITWNDIHHKTSIWGGPRCFGYPDPTYLVRVTEELREKGITAD
ncbi:probable E3 ubiquitin-protein ligase DTX3 isoform X2 [Corythoichthys intestinalis]|uniref:probable E3 ubiquitin-protein ligase DTX3 isoform X2 n=1 Tax=Corythoichthys intestinalis TaxID=161448 RepID=UPI0025A57BBD|nr:probable E3 ubiquitin-protein ligase DTX3 isoform X2 [Corythoichthys intestinalis]